MNIGITCTLKSHVTAPHGAPEDALVEYDSDTTLTAVRQALERLGHTVRPLGYGRALLENLLARRPDLVFNFAEGVGGRSRAAQVPAVLEMLGVPYTHSDPLTLGVTQDKAMAKRIVASHGLATPRSHVAYQREAWMCPAGNSLRVTFDRHVLCEPEFSTVLNDRFCRPVPVFGRQVVFELKFTDRLPAWCGELIRAFDLVRGGAHIKVFGGGGGVIVKREIDQLHAYGVSRIFSPHDGQTLGLPGMINQLIRECDVDLSTELPLSLEALFTGDAAALARVITAIEADRLPSTLQAELGAAAGSRRVPVLGITGTGGSGKSSLTDELVRRFRSDQQDKLRIGVVAVDPTRRKGGGALLGDRIRMNSVDRGNVYFRSLATRRAGSEIPDHLGEVIALARATHDLVIVETPGIGQGDAGIVPYVDVSLYVMTPEYGAASQLEIVSAICGGQKSRNAVRVSITAVVAEVGTRVSPRAEAFSRPIQDVGYETKKYKKGGNHESTEKNVTRAACDATARGGFVCRGL